MLEEFHTPVLLKEALNYLAVKSEGKYIDATVGGGGLAAEILGLGGELLGIDLDHEAVEYANKRLAAKFKVPHQRTGRQGSRFKVTHGNFRDLAQIARKHGFGRVDGVLFDLGVSWHQLKTPQRGFSFAKESRLDMRFDSTHQKVSAVDLLNALSEKELYVLFSQLGQERLARTIAAAVVSRRGIKPLEKTTQLAELVCSIYAQKGIRTRIHPATRVFLALRIAVNSELDNLRLALPQAAALLKSRGRLVVISFNSLEDGAVKDFLRNTGCTRLKVLTPRPIRPGRDEIEKNPRARSAKLRAAEKN